VGYRTVTRLVAMLREAESNDWELPIGGGYVAKRRGDLLACVLGRGGGERHGEIEESSVEKQPRNQGNWMVADLNVTCEIASWTIMAEREKDDRGQREGGVVLYNVEPGSSILIRTRRAGDSFWCQGRPRKVLVKDYQR